MSNANVGKVFNVTGDGGVSAKLSQRFDNLINGLLTEQAVYHALYDSNGETILDSNGTAIEARLLFVMK